MGWKREGQVVDAARGWARWRSLRRKGERLYSQ